MRQKHKNRAKNFLKDLNFVLKENSTNPPNLFYQEKKFFLKLTRKTY